MNRNAITSWVLMLLAAAGCATQEAADGPKTDAQASAPAPCIVAPDRASEIAPSCCFTVADLGVGLDSEDVRYRLIIPFIPSSKMRDLKRVLREKGCDAVKSKETGMSDAEKSNDQETGAFTPEQRRAAVRQARTNIAQSRDVEISRALLNFDAALSASERLAEQRAANFEEVMGQAYQVIGILAFEAGLADSPEVQRALDYFAANAFSEDFLPFALAGKDKDALTQ
ncbi:hypothetical protein [Hyphococcus sp.]|uniref:hypothetical protein n=1 Tax=Hyphococcus sp. TaxID=2038636 RepID=UPI0035C74290